MTHLGHKREQSHSLCHAAWVTPPEFTSYGLGPGLLENCEPVPMVPRTRLTTEIAILPKNAMKRAGKDVPDNTTNKRPVFIAG
jgi:hypothetical protein